MPDLDIPQLRAIDAADDWLRGKAHAELRDRQRLAKNSGDDAEGLVVLNARSGKPQRVFSVAGIDAVWAAKPRLKRSVAVTGSVS